MKKTGTSSIDKILAWLFIAGLIILSGCATAVTSTAPALNLTLTPQAIQPDQFYSVTKDGVEVACPKHWQTYSEDPSLVYGVCRADTLRIVIGVLPALDQSYYDSLVEQGTGHRTTIAGYLAYRNDYTYSWNGHEIINYCITVVNNAKACHIMILCDTAMLKAFDPTFEYVINSLKFQ